MATPPREGPPFLLPVDSRLIKGMTEEKGPASARSRKAPPYRRTRYDIKLACARSSASGLLSSPPRSFCVRAEHRLRNPERGLQPAADDVGEGSGGASREECRQAGAQGW